MRYLSRRKIGRLQEQKRSKRLFLNICMFPLPYAAYRLLGKGTLQIYEINSGKGNI